MSRTIVHIDMNAFFASVEQMCNPALRGKPVIVCGDPHGRSVVSTASYEARKYGVGSGMPVGEAKRRCPNGIYVEGNPRKYVYYSLRLFQIYSSFTSVVEPFSIDEAFLDLSRTVYGGFEEARSSGVAIKDAIKGSFPRLSASIGIAPNKYIAKMASFLEKPDGLVVIRNPVEYRRIFWPRSVETLWGIGEKTKNVLNSLDIVTVEHLAKAPLHFLKGHFGENGEGMHSIAWGKDDTPVIPYYQGVPAKSMGHEHTLSRDIGDADALEGILLRLCDQVGRRLRKEGCKARTVCVKLRYPDFKTIQRQTSLARYIDDDIEIFRVARDLLRKHLRGRKLRLLGVTASNLVYNQPNEDTLFIDQQKRIGLISTIDSLRDKYGEDSLIRAGIMGRRRRRCGANPHPLMKGFGRV